MINIEIPSFKKLDIENIVFDYNGTLAVDGKLIKGVKENLIKLSKEVRVYVLTADTFGTVKENFKNMDINVHIISKENGTEDKLEFIKKIGSTNTIAIGNGNNDRLMLEESAIGICILGNEGLATQALLKGDIVLKDIMDVFSLIVNRKRLIATLRK